MEDAATVIAHDAAPLSARAPASALAPPATGLLATLAAVSFVGHTLVAGNYGYFRDELYYLADGRHLQAGYVDQPLLMGWLAALLRVLAGDSLVVIHLVPASACALLVVVTGLMARELGGGWAAQSTAAVAALFCVAYLATGSIFSMDVLDQLCWALASLLMLRLLRREEERFWLGIGLVVAVALITKLTVLFWCLALFLGLLGTPERRWLRTKWPWLAAAFAFLGLLPYLLSNAANGWPTVAFYHHYSGVGTDGPLAFLAAQVGLMNPVAVPLAAAGLVRYFRPTGRRYRLLGWMFVILYALLTVLQAKSYFLAPAYPILFAAGAVAFETWRLQRWLAWLRPAFVALLALVGILLAPAVMPILPPALTVRAYGALEQPLADRLGWDTLTRTVEQVYAALPPAERAQACVLTSNYGEAGALQQLAAPGSLPSVISGHNNYFLWGPGACTGKVLILVGYSASDVQAEHTLYTHTTLAAVDRCQYCVGYEQAVPIYVLSGATSPIFPWRWPALKHFD